jgi:NAD(P)H-dependent flavin oxidoreductase YrpB (nitropropane dioxygenase family)
MLRTDLVNSLEEAGRTRTLTRAIRRAARFRKLSGLTWPQLIRDGLTMKHGKDLTWSQVLLAANTPMLLRASMVEGRTDLGVMASGQVAGLIEDLPSCAELVERTMIEASDALVKITATMAPLQGRGELRDKPPLPAHERTT